MDLSQEQLQILEGKICPYCKKETEYADSSTYYSNGVSYGMIYICRPCDALVGVHKGTDKALGRLANSQLRTAKKLAHEHFDKLWKEKHMSRSAAYIWLSQTLNIPHKYTHIGMFSLKTCQRVVDVAIEHLKTLK